MANKLQADEISSIIKERIANFEIDVDINEVGKVVGVADGITSVYGLNNVMAGEVVEFELGELSVKEFSKVRSRLNYVFRGVMLKAKFADHLKGKIYILPEEFEQYLTRSIKHFTKDGAFPVQLGNEAFEEIFMVYATSGAPLFQLLSALSLHSFASPILADLCSSLTSHVCCSRMACPHLLSSCGVSQRPPYAPVRSFYHFKISYFFIVLHVQC